MLLVGNPKFAARLLDFLSNVCYILLTQSVHIWATHGWLTVGTSHGSNYMLITIGTISVYLNVNIVARNIMVFLKIYRINKGIALQYHVRPFKITHIR